MPRQTLSKAMPVTIACIMLYSMAPAAAGAWMPQTTGMIGPMQSSSRTIAINTPKDGGGREIRRVQGMCIESFISGGILGVLLGLILGSRVLSRMLHQWQSRQEKQRDIDQLTAQFQALFRAIDQGKNQRP